MSEPSVLEDVPGASSDGEEEGAWIDRTNCADGAIGVDYKLTPDVTDLCLTNNRLPNLDGLTGVPRVRRLILRQNALKVLPRLFGMPLLVELDLYINAISTIDPGAFVDTPRLVRLDLSFNDVRQLSKIPVATLKALKELYLISNKLKVIENLHSMPNIEFLELGDNRIRVMENLSQLPSLRSLWLGKNKIEVIQNVDDLPNLRILSLQSNRITEMGNLHNLKLLEELYLSNNGLTEIKGLEELKFLRLLDLGANSITHPTGLRTLVTLKELWINDNKLESFAELEEELSPMQGIETVYLEGNPLAREPGYEERALAALPASLEQLDALPVEDVRSKLAESAASEPAEASNPTTSKDSDVPS